MQIPRDGEEPRSKPGVGSQPARALHQPQPRFFEQVLGDVAAARQAQQEREEAHVERIVDGIECRRVSIPEPLDERQLGFPVHPRY